MSRAPSSRGGGFRGLVAPASLKDCEPTGTPAFRPRFRGLVAPASLKADQRDGPGGVGHHGFRGLVAPASLKARGVCPELAPVRSFRGLVAPASLKVHVLGGIVCLHPVSGALLPRPH